MRNRNLGDVDALVQLRHDELHAQLEELFYAGGIPRQQRGEFEAEVEGFGTLRGVYNLLLRPPKVILDDGSTTHLHRLTLRMPFANSALLIEEPLSLSWTKLGGYIELDALLFVSESDGAQRALIKISDTIAAEDIVLDEASRGTIPASYAPIVLRELAKRITDIVTALDGTELGQDIPTDKLAVDDFGVNIRVEEVQAEVTRDRQLPDAVSVILRTEDRDALVGVRSHPLLDEHRAVAQFSREFLLGKLLRPALADALTEFGSGGTWDDNHPLRLRDLSVGHGFTVDRLEVELQAGQLEARLEASGTFEIEGTRAGGLEVRAEAIVELSLEDGELVVRERVTDLDYDVDLEWWVYLVGFLLAGAIAPMLHVVAALIAILATYLERFVPVVRQIFSALEPHELRLPLGPLGRYVEIQAILLDHYGLAIAGDPRPVELGDRYVEGRRVRVPDNIWIDLDDPEGGAEGLYGPGRKADLHWTDKALLPTSDALVHVFAPQEYPSLDAITPRVLATANYSAEVELRDLPHGGSRERPEHPRYLGVLTSEGRLARVAAWTNGVSLFLDFDVFDIRGPSVAMRVDWHESGRKETGRGTDTWTQLVLEGGPLGKVGSSGPMNAGWVAYDLAHEGVFEYEPTLLADPILRVRWLLDGHVLSGTGEIEIEGKKLSWAVNKRRCILRTELGLSVEGLLAVVVEDPRGVVRSDRVEFEVVGYERRGGRPSESRIEPVQTFEIARIRAEWGIEEVARFDPAIDPIPGDIW